MRSTQSPNAEGVEDDSKCGGPFDSKREDKSTDLPNADGLLEIEQLIKGKMFSRYCRHNSGVFCFTLVHSV